MSSPQNFRGALNGFNREDVVNYISYISNKHETQVNALRTEADELRRELEEREQAFADLNTRTQDLEAVQAELDQIKAEKQELQEATEDGRVERELLQEELLQKNARIEAQEKTIADQSAQIARLKQELEAAKTAAVAEPKKAEAAARWNEELNAYRRAESAERRARERVNQMYDRANAALAEASVRVEHTATQVAELAGKVEADLALLRQSIENSEHTLADTAMVLGAIRPDTD